MAMDYLWIGLCFLFTFHYGADEVVGVTNEAFEYDIFEEDPPGSLVGNVKRDSPYLNSKYDAQVMKLLRLTLRQTSGVYTMFKLNATTGVLTTTRPIDREELCESGGTDCGKLVLDIKVTPTAYFDIIQVIVNLLDKNDHIPVFPKSKLQWSISENSMPDATFSVPGAVDRDGTTYGVQIYELVDETRTFDLRLANHSDGMIDVSLVLKQKLDRESRDFYEVKIIAWDGGKPPQSATLLIDITVTDSNDNNPSFEKDLYTASVYEKTALKTPVIRVHATDPDQGLNGEIVYAFPPNPDGTSVYPFDINNKTGDIIVSGVIDYEQATMYNLKVMARDRGLNSLPAFAKVVINVKDINDHAPLIAVNALTESGHTEAMENAPTGTFVAHIAVSDPDSGKNGQVDCTTDSNYFDLQKLSESEYKLVTQGSFDREKRNVYRVTLTCHDRGTTPQMSTRAIEIHIADENDHSPVLPRAQYEFTLAENNQVNAFVAKINATDRDTGRNAAIRYEIHPKTTDDKDILTIDSISGLVRATISFDHEKRRDYDFILTASDHGDPPRSASADVHLSIEDTNDEPPVFSEKSYSFETVENVPANSEIGQIVATDLDSPPYDQILYSLDARYNPDNTFAIDTNTGKIFAARKLDREKREKYHLKVIATNAGFEAMTSTVIATVVIKDENDNSPKIIFPTESNKTVQISNQVPIGQIVTRIIAHDNDSGVNAVLEYKIIDNDHDGDFDIDHLSGHVSVVKDVSKYKQKLAKLKIRVRDGGYATRTTFTELDIVVNKSVPYPLAQSSASVIGGSNFMILIGSICGVVLVAIMITIITLAIKVRQRRIRKRHLYNCRKEEAHKAISNMAVGLDTDSPCKRPNIPDSPSIHSGHNKEIDNRVTKKETALTADMEDSYLDRIPATWPLQSDTPSYQSSPQFKGRGVTCTEKGRPPRISYQNSDEKPDHGLPYVPGKPRLLTTARDRQLRGGAKQLANGPVSHNPGHGNKENPAHLTRVELELHDMLNISQNDRDSESGCSGSCADSGRGPSEEGDLCTYGSLQLDPYSSGDSRNSSSQSETSGPLKDISAPSQGKPVPQHKPKAPHSENASDFFNGNLAQNSNETPPHELAPQLRGNDMRYLGNEPSKVGYPSCYNNNKLSTFTPATLPTSSNNQWAPPQLKNPSQKKKEVRFAEDCIIVCSEQNQVGSGQHQPPVDVLSLISDDGTTTSGSYIIDPTEMDQTALNLGMTSADSYV